MSHYAFFVTEEHSASTEPVITRFVANLLLTTFKAPKRPEYCLVGVVWIEHTINLL